MSKNRGKALVETISTSPLYRDYERAFSETTRLPLSFRPAQYWNFPQSGKKFENPFCAMVSKASATCSACLEQKQGLSNAAADKTATLLCFAGLAESAIPVRLGNDLLGFLQTGQVAFQKPNAAQFKKIVDQLKEWGVETDLQKLEEAYFHTQMVPQDQYQSVLRLLEVFAKHLAISADQIVIRDDTAEPPSITRAKQFINERQGEDMGLSDIAKLVNMSTCHFCKMFKRATGMTFTAYLSLVRVSKAKTLLLNPNLRVSEIAFEAGFQSLPHFNRVFRKLAGESPTQYREKQLNGGILTA